MNSKHCFHTQPDALAAVQSRPASVVFVGSTVNAVYTEKKQKRSDVLTVARFLHRLLENKQGWAVQTIQKIIDGETGLVDPDERDVFADKFEYLRKSRRKAETVYRDILANIFHAPAGAGSTCAISAASRASLALRSAGAEDYFGLIYIGDTSAFKKLVEEDDSGVQVEEDVLSPPSSRASTNRRRVSMCSSAPRSSWRAGIAGASPYGAAKHRAQRGFRDHSAFWSRRASARPGTQSQTQQCSRWQASGAHQAVGDAEHLAVRANYMAQFRDYLEREGIETAAMSKFPCRFDEMMDSLAKGF